jgi:hypothetical protein
MASPRFPRRDADTLLECPVVLAVADTPRITDTQLKLRDAGIQMKLASEKATNDDVFRSCINAFIATARSITMVMERESAPNAVLLAWYKQQTSILGAQPLFRFFNEQRVHTIHKGVVRPERGGFAVSDMRWWQQHDPQRGLVTAGRFRAQGEEPPAQVGDVIITGPNFAITWSFPGAVSVLPSGSTNVFRLCEEYSIQLKSLVHLWLAKRQEICRE